MRLVVICDPKGVPVGYDLVRPKTGEERESVFALATAHPESLLYCDGGFCRAEYRSSMELIDVDLVTPDKHRLSERPPSEIRKPGSGR
jgi:hypothetical protein